MQQRQNIFFETCTQKPLSTIGVGISKLLQTNPFQQAARINDMKLNTRHLYFGTLPIAFLLGSFFVGCGANTATTNIDLDPMVISLSEEDEIIFGDAVELFTQAGEHLRAGEHEAALRRYLLLREYFPDISYMRTVSYNMGLCFEGLDDWEHAASMYQEVVENWPATSDATDALFRWAEAHSQLGQYEEVVPLMERVLRRARLTLFDRMEGHVRWANAALETRDYAPAEQHYREAIRINRQAEMHPADENPANQPLAEFHPILVQAHFGLGRTYHDLFLQIKLTLPEDNIRQALVDKGQLLEQARVSYVEAVRAGHPYWSPAAGFMIGQIYEDFYLDILACEVPHDFDAMTLEVYFTELRDYLRPLIERAMSVYEDNLAMSDRMRADSVWVEETEMGIQRIERYLFDDEFQDQQELLIREQAHPHSAGDPSLRWTGPEPPPDV